GRRSSGKDHRRRFLGVARARQQFRDPVVALGFTALKPPYACSGSARPAAWAGRPLSLPAVVSVEVVDAGGDVDAVPPNISCVGSRGRGEQRGGCNGRDDKFAHCRVSTLGFQKRSRNTSTIQPQRVSRV